MTVFRFNESRQSRSGTTEPPSETRIYTAAGSNDQAYVYAYAATTGTAASITHASGLLYRQDISVSPIGYELFRVEVPYGPRKRESGEYSLDFDTTGGTLHITNSKETVNKYTAPGKPDAQDMGGAIGVNGDDVSGTEIVIPALRLTVNFKHPAAVITLSHVKNLVVLDRQDELRGVPNLRAGRDPVSWRHGTRGDQCRD